MNKFQPFNFRNMDEFREHLPDNELQIFSFLRQLIDESFPHYTEKLAYNVPFYYGHTRICFIWPPSVPWGNAGIKGVQLGFCNGYLMQDELNYLSKGARKQVYWREYSRLDEIDPDIVKAYLHEAYLLDESLAKSKKSGI